MDCLLSENPGSTSEDDRGVDEADSSELAPRSASDAFEAGDAERAVDDDFAFNDLVYVTIPSDPPPGAKLADDRDGWTQCLLRHPALATILSTPGFPRRPHYPPDVCFCIGPSKHGLGMFATRDLSMGDHILTERPLTVTPTTIPMPKFARCLEGLTDEQRRQAILDRWEKAFLLPCFNRLDSAAQADFLDLANSHAEDGSGPILGVIRTNGFEVAGVVDPGPDGEYAAVCRIMCRINHSCSPSADRLFDIASFSFQLRATRDVKQGEEIFVSYCNVLETAADRQEYLASYGIKCTCNSCLPDTTASDQRRLDLRRSIDAIDNDYDTWLADPLLADDYTIKISLRWISVIQQEALEASDAYRHHLHAIVKAYVALGDAENAVKYGRLLGLWALGQSGKEDMLRKMENPGYHRGRPDWGIRVCAEDEGLGEI
ncbi:hypothetical protein LshimejAT787_0603430 [Lyophyllum shimeji]|uniref:SET domain-containing protein n=1 Tax=Lyophyllum shimeji TaxID=47721 RepID=A0A9P3PPU1_LYOSH|nr:hypothetical protein LshimejAT787_0603430 [Lyophyllum shimeji]